jgi:arginine decarboxylase-like protein
VSSQADRRDEVVSSIILINHPFFSSIRRQMKVPYRFVVETVSELNQWVIARGFSIDPFCDPEGNLEWYRNSNANGTSETLKISRSIFDENERLKHFSADEWSDDFIDYNIRKDIKTPKFDLDDDIPF